MGGGIHDPGRNINPEKNDDPTRTAHAAPELMEDTRSRSVLLTRTIHFNLNDPGLFTTGWAEASAVAGFG